MPSKYQKVLKKVCYEQYYYLALLRENVNNVYFEEKFYVITYLNLDEKMIAEIIQNSVSNLLSLSTLSLIRAVFILGVIFLITYRLIPWCKLIQLKCQIIDLIPGPKCFNPILGNVPMAICRNILGDSEESKNLLVSK